MTEFLKNIKKPFLAAFLAVIILILASLTGPNLNTVSGDLLGCGGDGICNVALICDTTWEPTCTTIRLGQVDVPLRDHLIALGHNVTAKKANDHSYIPEDFDVVVISDSADSAETAWLKNKVVGILTVDAHNNEEFCLASTSEDNRPPLNVITITDIPPHTWPHYITQEFGPLIPNPKDVQVGGTQSDSGGYMAGWGNSVKSLAYYQGSPASSTLLVVAQGGTLVSFGITGACRPGFAGSAAARRVFFGARLFGNLNAAGREMFDRAFAWAAHLDPVAALSGSLESSTFDTGITGGAAFNSIMWQGTPGVGVGTAVVKFQLATANCSGGETNPPTCSGAGWGGTKTEGDGAFVGPNGSSAATDVYQPSGPGAPSAITTKYHNNKRYFRYKIFLEKDAAVTSPIVRDVIINWSP